MRELDRDPNVGGPAPGRARSDGPDLGLAATAAAEGRWDAVDADGLLALQRSVGNAGVAAALSPVHETLARPGRGLPADVKAPLEAGFGMSLDHVRLHDDTDAVRSAGSVGAYAYASGNNIVVPQGAPLHTYAEEVEHTFQQASGPVAGSPDGKGHLVSDPSDRFEVAAAAKADDVVRRAGGGVA